MEHFTGETVGKTVVVGDAEVGTVTAIEGDEAVLEPESGLAAEMEAALASGGSDALSITPDQVETVSDELIHVRVDD